jgi:hypothetical protein
MAGLALYGDLGEFLASQAPEALLHRGESVKILNQDGDNAGALYGDVCREAIARAEIAAPERVRSICLAVTAKEDMDRGKPSSWSSTLDALVAGSEDENRRLIFVSAGNTDPAQYDQYPNSNVTDSIHDPAQAWNVVTVGGDDENFIERINLKARADEDARRSYASSDEDWLIGPINRNRGSLHSDRWRGPASDLAARGRIAVYPTMGWWRERKRHQRWNQSARYALIVSIAAPEASVDLYTAVKNQLAIPISVRGADLR